NYWKDPSIVTSFLPFNNNFLKVRNAAALVNAKNELSSALKMANASMNYWYGSGGTGSSRFSAAAKVNYQWAKDGWAAAETAVDSGGVFYFPKKLPKSEPGALWPGQASADYGVDLTRLFIPGALGLTNFFTTEQGGKAPSLFKIKWYYEPGTFNAVWTDEGTLVTSFIERDGAESYPEGEAPWGYYSYEVNTKNLKELFPKGFSGFGDKAYFYKVFPHVVLWSGANTYMDGRKLTAASLYKYYHYDYQY
ncbi:MAG: hypothetical protein LBL28_05140, partial [Treponema sp.]|nr:hypothetical protein [Treponema sp.]